MATRAPAGYVVTSLYNSGTCDVSLSEGNTYVLALPPNGRAICDVTAIPAGYHVTSVYNTGNCGTFIGNGGNTYTIAS